MNLKNVKLILSREVRDQLRDRRTLFMMFVLPILLYPLLGMLFLQIQQFVQDKSVRVLVVGAQHGTGRQVRYRDLGSQRLTRCQPRRIPSMGNPM